MVTLTRKISYHFLPKIPKFIRLIPYLIIKTDNIEYIWPWNKNIFAYSYIQNKYNNTY